MILDDTQSSLCVSAFGMAGGEGVAFVAAPARRATICGRSRFTSASWFAAKTAFGNGKPGCTFRHLPIISCSSGAQAAKDAASTIVAGSADDVRRLAVAPTHLAHLACAAFAAGFAKSSISCWRETGSNALARAWQSATLWHAGQGSFAATCRSVSRWFASKTGRFVIASSGVSSRPIDMVRDGTQPTKSAPPITAISPFHIFVLSSRFLHNSRKPFSGKCPERAA